MFTVFCHDGMCSRPTLFLKRELEIYFSWQDCRKQVVESSGAALEV